MNVVDMDDSITEIKKIVREELQSFYKNG